MAIKKAARKVARKAVSKVKRAAKQGSRKRVVRKSSKKVKPVTKRRPRKNSQKKRTSKKKPVSKRTRVTRKRRLSTKKKTPSRKRRARKPSTKRRRRKQNTEEVVAVDQEKTTVAVDQQKTTSEQAVVVDELKAEASGEASTKENDFDSASLEAQENVAQKEERGVVESDSVSGYEIQADKLFDEQVEDVQTPDQERLPESPDQERLPESPDQESLPESREPETESREPEKLYPGTLFDSTERESEPESDYVIVTKEDAEKCTEVGSTEETSVAVEEPVLANHNLKDTEPARNVESDEDVRRWQEEEAEAQEDDSSSLPSFGLKDVPASSEVDTSTSAVPLM